MSFSFLLGFFALSGIGLWFWRDSLGAREHACAASARACQQSQVQLLDDTVALERLWWRRDRDGRLKLERLYLFEFSDTGQHRRIGSVLLVGWRVEVLHMEGGDLLVP
ncbi:MAG: DUF3301 domain-containing protein [Candidatus Competibacteraceae bacterium]|uniref:DUF3301 domain-containing protein n=1 Tax=Candidatus Contendobacter odensis Run_B_J11 TaxID=1400861 RepID=A0A7U7GB68_9GAMM|nr:DUF3301 domain-containing protein [Candidatus Contendobacter odensis]MBK8537057.1 DUF3301 domain-containing protein [Candidatus Competibacteraceae bacterium]MBK8754443.1 DUF3301 domain-containing protein [Candidatus Competibacteraceae bacterium]CDH44928.1 conserved hypothetical protein [Candidatus Contendobacter odensis Run_B_J11]